MNECAEGGGIDQIEKNNRTIQKIKTTIHRPVSHSGMERHKVEKKSFLVARYGVKCTSRNPGTKQGKIKRGRRIHVQKMQKGTTELWGLFSYS